MNRLDQQVAIVTGGARGIGAAICELFCQQGATVAMWDVLEEGEQKAAEIRAAGGSIQFQKVDITNFQKVEQTVNDLANQYGRIDILINNAGVTRDRSFMKMSVEEWDTVRNINLNGLFNTCKAVIPHMRAGGYGRIVSASSINGILGAFGQTNYAATKAATIGFTKSMAKEVGKYGITANAIAPGFVKTAMTEAMPKEVIDAAIQTIPVKRVGQPMDLAYAYLFLASKEAAFVNGEVLNVNGGSY